MATTKQINEEIEITSGLKMLAQSYEEISVVQMQKIKASVLRTRDFLTDLSDVFVDVKSSYKNQIIELMAKKHIKNTATITAINKNGRTLMVYLSSNAKLYGSVTQKVFHLFADAVKTSDDKTDVAVVGSVGKELYQNMSLAKKYQYFDMPDNKIKFDDLKPVVKSFISYEKIYVYYGHFDNMVTQSGTSASITGEQPFESPADKEPRKSQFIFEPSLDHILKFFENQILTALFTQTLLENQLSRLSSRVNAMEEALLHIAEETKMLNQKRIRIKHLTQNKKQLETVSGVALWS